MVDKDIGEWPWWVDIFRGRKPFAGGIQDQSRNSRRSEMARQHVAFWQQTARSGNMVRGKFEQGAIKKQVTALKSSVFTFGAVLDRGGGGGIEFV